MMISEQYGALLIASPCESGIKRSFYSPFNKLQWLFMESFFWLLYFYGKVMSFQLIRKLYEQKIRFRPYMYDYSFMKGDIYLFGEFLSIFIWVFLSIELNIF